MGNEAVEREESYEEEEDGDSAPAHLLSSQLEMEEGEIEEEVEEEIVEEGEITMEEYY